MDTTYRRDRDSSAKTRREAAYPCTRARCGGQGLRGSEVYLSPSLAEHLGKRAKATCMGEDEAGKG